MRPCIAFWPVRLGNALKKLGVKKADRAIIQMPKCPEVLQSFRAVYAIGAVVVPVNFMVGDEETAYIYRDTGAETVAFLDALPENLVGKVLKKALRKLHAS